jgi:hypothetical protein
MLKQPMPGMTDTLEFVKNLWGGMQIPGMSGMPAMPAPALSVEELDKKIADLKAVEAWLNLNLGMLHGTIQALEVQRGTLATLRAMSDSMAQAMNQTGAASDAAMAPFAQFFNQAAQKGAPAASGAQAAGTPEPSPSASASAAQGSAEAPNAGMPAAVAWWNLLQDQFRQAVTSAMPPDGGAHPDKTGAGSAAPGQAAGSPLDVSGGAPQTGPSGNASANGQNNGPGDAPNGDGAGARRSGRGKTDKA